MEAIGKITAVERQKKAKSRVSVYVDDVYLGSVEDIVWANSGLKAGDLLQTAVWEDMRVRQEQRAALDRAMGYLGARARSRAEVERYLAQKGFSPEAASAAVEKLVEYGYLNDGEVAAMFVRDRLALKGAGRRAIAVELKKLGIEEAAAQAALEQYSPEDEQEAALRQAQKALKTMRESDPKKRKAKLYANLARHGFPPEVIGRAMNAALGKEGEDSAPGWE